MKIFLTLLKVDLMRLFGLNKAIRSGKGGRRILMLAAVAVLIGLLVVVESAAMTAVIASFFEQGSRYKALSLSLCVYFIVMLFLTIGTSRVLFGCSDYDLLMSLPVKPSAVVLSKIAYVYIVDFLFAVAFLIPAAVICGIADARLIPYCVCAVPACLVLPILPMSVGIGIGTLVSYVMTKIKNKTVSGIIASVVFIALYLLFVFGTQTSDDNEIAAFFASSAFAPVWFVAAGISGKPLNLLAFVFGSLAVGAVCTWLISKNFKRINMAISAKTGGGKFVMTGQERTSVTKTLFKREIKLFASSATNIMNSLIGPVIAIALAVMFVVNGGVSSFVDGADLADAQVAETLKKLSEMLTAALPFIPLMMISVSTYSSYAFSLEGKRLWVLKSLPVSAKSIVKVKLFVALMLTLPAGLVATVIMGIGLNAGVFDVIVSCIIVCAYSLFGVTFGLVINLKFNFFDWRSEAEVVKRGSSVMICMLVGMLGVLPLGAIQIASTMLANRYLGWVLILAILAVLCAVFLKILFSTCEEKFLRLGEDK